MLAKVTTFLPFQARPNLVIDLGNRNTIVWRDDSGTAVSAPTAVAFKKEKNGTTSLFAVGSDALELEGRAQRTVELTRPLQNGMVTDVFSATHLLKELAKDKKHKNTAFDKIIISVPATATAIEKKAFADVAASLNARKVYVIPEPLAAAIGTGLDVTKPHGRCIVDIGDGIIESVLLSMGEVVTASAVRLEERSFETLLRSYLRESHNFYVGREEAERIKILLSVPVCPTRITLKGLCFQRGLPVLREFAADEFKFIRHRFASDVGACVLQTLEALPPEMSSDLSSDGIFLTGGNSIDPFLLQYLEKTIPVKFTLAENPLLAVVKGNKRALEDEKFLSVLERCA